jgi:hypothetical protein
MVLAYHTGIPLVNADLTRTSVGESKKIVQIVTPDFYDKEIRADITDPRPFLIVRSGEKLTASETSLLRKAEPVMSSAGVGLYRLEVAALFGHQGGTESLAKGTPSLGANITDNEGLDVRREGGTESLVVGTESLFYHYEDFESRRSDTAMRGEGAFSGRKAGKNVLIEFPPGTFEAGTDYVLSIWMFNGEPDALNLWFRLIVEEYDEKEGKWHETVFFPEEAETIYGDWSLVEGTFRITDPRNQVSIVTKGKSDSDAAFHADDLLIRKEGEDILWRDGDSGFIFFNNHRIKTD